jgi:hypothetical protein
MAINAHRAFHSATSRDNYLGQLTPDDAHIDELRLARELVRDALKVAFRDWESTITEDELFEDAARAIIFASERSPTLSPKFRGQGSYSYHTLNRPTHFPPQEMDFDDGMFLPVSFLTQDHLTAPAVASAGYFKAVETALSPLCERKRWTLNPERPRPSCVRISLNNDRSHLDIALYAIPDDQFHVLLEKAAADRGAAFSDDLNHDTVSFSEDVYDQIAVDQIMLAHREEGWKQSDPRKLENWFNERVVQHSQQLRRVCRYLKGWRDAKWHDCKLSSIALMASAVRAFDESPRKFEGRDDQALLMVVARLPELFSQEIANPVVQGRLDEGWDQDGRRKEFVAAAEALHSELEAVLAGGDARTAIGKLCSLFGPHFPNDVALITVEAYDKSPAILTSGMIDAAVGSDIARTAPKIGGNNRFGC